MIKKMKSFNHGYNVAAKSAYLYQHKAETKRQEKKRERERESEVCVGVEINEQAKLRATSAGIAKALKWF